MFCPRCRSEYRPGFTRCAHCEVELVSELPPADDFESPDAMARLLEGKEMQPLLVGSPVDLAEAQHHLAGQRIASVLASEADDGAGEAAMHQRVFLMVAADDLERAREGIQRRWREGAIAQGLVHEEAASVSVDACPACGAAVPADAGECPDCGLFLGEAERSEG